MILAPFRKQNSFSNQRKGGKCLGTDLVDSMLDTLNNILLFTGYFNFMWQQITKKHLPILRPGVCFKSMESTKCGPNFPLFLELLKVFCFLKGASTSSLSFRPLSLKMPKYIGNNTTCTCYAMSQHNMQLLNCSTTKITFSQKPFKKKTCNHS